MEVEDQARGRPAALPSLPQNTSARRLGRQAVHLDALNAQPLEDKRLANR